MIAVDTNILIYTHDPREPSKQACPSDPSHPSNQSHPRSIPTGPRTSRPAGAQTNSHPRFYKHQAPLGPRSFATRGRLTQRRQAGYRQAAWIAKRDQIANVTELI